MEKNNALPEYLDVLYRGIVGLYISICTTRLTHPYFKEYVRNILSELVVYSNKTTLTLERLVLDSIVNSIRSIVDGRQDKVFVSSKHIEDTINKYSDTKYGDLYHNVFNKEVYKPFIDTISNVDYIGKAWVLHLIFTNKDIYLENSGILNFDNTNRSSYRDFHWKYLSSFDFSYYTFDSLISLFGKNSLPPIMLTDLTFREACRITYFCKLKSNFKCTDMSSIRLLFSNLTNQENRLDFKNSLLFQNIAKYIDINDDTSRYLINDTSTISEKEEYQKSYLKGYDVSNVTKGLEAVEDDDPPIDEDPADDDPTDEDTDPETDDENTDEEEPDPDAEEEEVTEGDDELDEEEDSENSLEDDILSISKSQSISLQLAGEEESLSDILYKTQVCQLVSNLKENPPVNLKTEELLLLELWCTQWIFLVNVQVTKDLLSELSITVE
jgi:hypothetical protein